MFIDLLSFVVDPVPESMENAPFRANPAAQPATRATRPTKILAFIPTLPLAFDELLFAVRLLAAVLKRYIIDHGLQTIKGA